MRNEQVIERPVDHRTLTKRYTEEAVRFIDANKSRPFFLYLAHSMPHIPLARSSGYVDHSSGGIYGDVIEEIDWSTGQVLDALGAAGVDGQTLVLFTSDNGPWLPFETHGGSAGPLREGKGSTWEGGVRTPAIFRWPGTVRPGTVTDIGSGLDLLPTAASIAGTRPPIRSRDRRRRPVGGAARRRHQPAPHDLLLLGQRAARGPEEPATRRTSSPAARMRRAASGPCTRRRCCSISPPIPASGSTSPRPIPTSSPTSSGRPTRIAARSCRSSRLFDELLPAPKP